MKLAWGNKVNQEFIDAVKYVCDALRWPVETHASWLLTCIAFETGGTFSPSARNARSGATGLIQFMPATARGLETTVEALSAMSVMEQMRYVARYFKAYALFIETLEDMYMSILMPRYIGCGLDEVVFEDGTVAYQQNSGFDKDKDGRITVREITEKIREWHVRGLSAGNFVEV